jgi:hypothetical protein
MYEDEFIEDAKYDLGRAAQWLERGDTSFATAFATKGILAVLLAPYAERR